MKKMFSQTMIVMLASVGLMVGNALATPVTFKMGNESEIDVSRTVGGLYMWAEVFDSVWSKEFTLDLDTSDSTYSDSYTFDFAKMGTQENWINSDDRIPQEITASLDFDVPNDSNEEINGITVGYSAWWGFAQGWTVNWSDPLSVALSNGVSFDIELSDTGFISGFWQGPDGCSGNAYSIVTATVTLTSETASAPAPVPEPATMVLFGTGLAGIAGFARRKKYNNKK